MTPYKGEGHGVETVPYQNHSAASSVAIEPSASKKAAQRAAMLERLMSGPLSTIEARETLGIMSPAARAFELRRAGLDIETRVTRGHDAWGNPHRMAEYVLHGGGAV